jgi:uncharacterized membrane protein SpoIIM required for sporulation
VNINEFVTERKEEWQKLEKIADKFKAASRPKISRTELWELGRLYSGAVSDLSVLKSSTLASDPNNDVIAYVNGLVIRAHGLIYRKAPFKWSSMAEFLVIRFPAAFREAILYVGLSFGIFFLFGIVGFALGLKEPGFIELVIPESIISTVEKGDVWFNDLFAMAPMASTGLMTHNIAVTFIVVASGITYGIGTVYLLALNGLLLGTVAALCMMHGLSLEFWSFVLPHGSVELSAIIIAGGAGLAIGHSLIDPGPYRRSEYLAVRTRRAVVLTVGCVPMLVLAGIIEAFFSPSPIPAYPKIGFAVALFTALVAFLLFSGGSAIEPGPAELHRDFGERREHLAYRPIRQKL